MGEVGSATVGQVIVTGANGYLGRACVAEARRQGLDVLALYRSQPLPAWQTDPAIRAIQTDLVALQGLPLARGVSALIHCAGHLGDDPKALHRDTIEATRRVLAAHKGRDMRVVLISSLAVYDTGRLSAGAALAEDAPLISAEDDRQTAYALAKRQQEALLTAEGSDAWVLRPGAIWGPGRAWHALQGFSAGALHVTIGSDGELPLSHVDHVAWAAVTAAQIPSQGISVLNVLDDDRPTRARFLRAHRRVFGWPKRNVTVPFGLWLAMVRLLRPVSGHLPGLFREPVLRARMMPLRYPNTALRSALRGEDIDTFEGLMARAGDAG